jgi:protein SCO1/2
MKQAILFAILAGIGASQSPAAQRYQVTGLILKIDRPHRNFVASCPEIPGYMEAMVMPIPVLQEKALDGLQEGKMVDFTLVVEAKDSHAENIHLHQYQSAENEPMLARRLQLLSKVGQTNSAVSELAPGQNVPDFTLTDQANRFVSLSQFTGKVVAVTFIYTSCPLPNYCFRLSNNFGRLQKRFAAQMGRDLVLLSITFDPVHDRPEVLAKYGATWHADPNSWHFLTGSVADVQAVSRKFGVDSWPDESTLTHSLHTAVIGRDGKLAANFEGNEFTAVQLGDYVATILNQPRQGAR